ncbi:MAG: cobyric acid synthase, partial [Selenomonas sp.]
VLGVIPHIEEMGIDDEDSVSLEDKSERAEEKELNLAVIRTPKISNFTDFDSLESEPDVALRYVHEAAVLGTPDLILLPGSKNTSEDMRWLEKTGLAAKIREAHEKGTAVIGICGGYQMLGKRILDPHHTESSFDSTNGLGLLGLQTTFHESKLTSQVVASARDFPFLGKRISVDDIKGYEIHMGTTEFLCKRDSHPLCVKERRGEVCDAAEGTVNAEENVFGTYIHGFFDHDGLRRAILNALREKKGLPALAVTRNRYREKEESYDRLAAVVRAHLDMDKLKEIMGEKVGC